MPGHRAGLFCIKIGDDMNPYLNAIAIKIAANMIEEKVKQEAKANKTDQQHTASTKGNRRDKAK